MGRAPLQASSERLAEVKARVIDLIAPSELTRLLLTSKPTLEPHPALVPCWLWTRGLSRGRPIFAAQPYAPRHPVAYFYGLPERIQRICSSSKCVNPYHFVCLPKPPQQLQHALVFEAELQIDRHVTLEQAIESIDIPAHYVVAAYRHKRLLGLTAS